jgi:hypothetical protein
VSSTQVFLLAIGGVQAVWIAVVVATAALTDQWPSLGLWILAIIVTTLFWITTPRLIRNLLR